MSLCRAVGQSFRARASRAFDSTSLSPRYVILPTQQTPLTPHRPIHQSATLYKQKGGKQDAKKNVEKAKGKADAAGNDPNDFTQLESQISKAQSRMKEELSKLRAGGQLNTDFLDSIKVEVDKSSKDAANLSDLAAIVPGTGRKILIMVGEKDHVKPIQSAILSSPHSLNPTPNPHNPLELQITIPPPTAESRRQVQEAADKIEQLTLHTIRQARGDQQKKMNAMEKAKSAQPDILRKAREKMEKLVENSNKEAKEIVKKAKAALEK